MPYFVGKIGVGLRNAHDIGHENCKDGGIKNVSKHVQKKDATCAKRSLLRHKSVTRRQGTSTSSMYMLGHKMRRLPPASQARERHGNRDHKVCREHTDSGRRFIFALLVQRPISPRTSCPTNTGRLQWLTRRSSDRKRALATPQQAKRLDNSRDYRGAGLGFSSGLWREPPENWEVGCETSRVRRDSQYRPLVSHSLHRYTRESFSL